MKKSSCDLNPAVGDRGYPRPDFDRSSRWRSLDGEWDFFPDSEGRLTPQSVIAAADNHRIAVPGTWEQGVKGVRFDWLGIGWYRRRISVPASWDGEHLILKFGAVFHACTVWVNGREVCSHVGGYLPFECDISDAVDDIEDVMLVLRVSAPANKLDIPHGKQRSIPFDDYNGCSFTPSSGIWQSVWIEPRPAVFISHVTVRASSECAGLEVSVEISDDRASHLVRATVEGSGSTSEVRSAGGAAVFDLALDNPVLWSPECPQLYYVAVEVVSDGGVDRVTTYTGLRSFEMHDGALFLNGRRIYLRGVLDQGYWPESGLAAPSDAALVRDLELARASGFNLVRKHVKVEDPRWLYHADRMGMLVWAEPPSTGRLNEASTNAFTEVLSGMVRRDGNHPCVVIWGAYNEEWGLNWDVEADPRRREAARSAYRLVKGLDGSRLVVDNSGWNHVETDIVDWHYYDQDPNSFARGVAEILSPEDPGFAVAITPSTTVKKRLWAQGAAGDGVVVNSEYGGGWDSLARAWHSRWQTQAIRANDRNQGYVYTELCDVEHETVGLYDFERREKDTCGVELWRVHAPTVIIPEVCPVAPGHDLVAEGASEVGFDARVSHHGDDSAPGTLRWRIGTHGPWRSAPLCVEPFVLSPPVRVSVGVPSEVDFCRLHLEFLVDSECIAATFVDVATSAPLDNTPVSGVGKTS